MQSTDAQVNSILQKSKQQQRQFVQSLDEAQLIKVLNQLDPDQATDLIQLLPTYKQGHIVAALQSELAEAVSALLPFAPDTAAGLMSLNYIKVDAADLLTTVVEKIRRHEQQVGKIPEVIVVEGTQVLGYIPGYKIALANPEQAARVVAQDLITIPHHANRKEVLRIFRQHPHQKVVVLGTNNIVLGVIYSDDILRLLHQETSASLYNFAGLHAEEDINDPAIRKVQMRYKWLIINLATAFLAAFTVGLFEGIIDKFVILAAYLPIVAGMGGNAATQTLAVMVRGITLNHVSLATVWRPLLNELKAAFANGVINGVIVAAIVLIVNKDPKIALILGGAMVTNLLVAAFFGTLIPLVLKSLGKDPATSATIFITTATDVLGFLAFLGLASLVLA
jgi:magnesium transporter